MRASTTMTREVVVVPPELRLSDAWEIMKRRKIHHLPVVRSGRLLGMLSDRDVLLRARPGPQDEPVVTTKDLVAAAMTPAPTTNAPSTPQPSETQAATTVSASAKAPEPKPSATSTTKATTVKTAPTTTATKRIDVGY